MATAPHAPVLYHEIIHALQPKSPGCYVDGTVGAGGHARGILEACAPEGRLLGLDVDPQALALARETLAPYVERVRLVQASYTSLARILSDETNWASVQGILLDLGASSMQFDTPQRGFSFQADGPLDMRFDPSNPRSAADLVNHLPEAELADIIYRYGEERAARRIAQALVRARPLRTTRQLASVIESVIPRRGRRVHPATRTFQALRIAVNDELGAIERVLPQALAALAPGGRLAVIAFHSLEDRLVKEFFRRESRDCICPPRQPICTCGHVATLKEIVRKPIRPGEAEVEENPRARSARLRVAEKLPTND
ncbi:MAG: 16S rRNA (cytosine(1402)-N(4))-methyltransferase RsmH [Chloroflexi bacterium]|nr:16S rRNA (cytosine(1402)-N(4))-methyltransferase RsmH [Chloroflexota bacterium]